jgi:hypothetical protein
MAIDPNTECIISLSIAAKLLPPRRRGRRPHVSCLYRWTISGCRGVVLESIQIGGTRCTSREALARFFDRLTSQRETLRPAVRPRTAAVRRRAVERAIRQLEAEGS